MARDFRITPLHVRLVCAAALLVTGFVALAIATRSGAVHLDAGEMTLVFGGGERGLTFDVASRGCPPDCDFGINWRPSLTLTGTGL
ncbi:MAG: hypothetical protein RIR41_3649 [Pseudomonadota bacterium]|jgi:hypothetical protein|nr:hypothetical protein [Hyphomonadaceae bacterium]